MRDVVSFAGSDKGGAKISGCLRRSALLLGSAAFAQEAVKVGVLHSLSGTMAISEITVAQATKLAIDEINAAGGVLGSPIEVIEEDGASDPATFAQKAQKLIQQDGVVTVFGGCTSASRKAMQPVFENTGNLLWYPCSSRATSARPTSCTRARSRTSRRCPR